MKAKTKGSKVESIKRLREYANVKWEPWNESREHLLVMLDEIESEIAERYMELPVDADGVPIHMGDVIQFVNEQGGTGAKVEVCAVSNYYAYYGEGKHFYRTKNCHHVKQRTVEDVLRDFVNEAEWEQSPDSYEEIERRLITLYAAEIRDLLGGDGR